MSIALNQALHDIVVRILDDTQDNVLGAHEAMTCWAEHKGSIAESVIHVFNTLNTPYVEALRPQYVLALLEHS